jgi:hypothetical protein
MSDGRNLAEDKWNEWCDKNGIAEKARLDNEQIERFQMSDEFGDILASLTPENQIAYCVGVGAWNRLRRLYGEFKKEHAYYLYAAMIEALLAKRERWLASKPN